MLSAVVNTSDRLHDTLDFDLDGRANALSDGILALRYMFGVRGEALVRGATSSRAESALSPAMAEEVLSQAQQVGMFDVDADGRVNALTDGILILRHLFGVSGDTLVHGAVAPRGARIQPDAVASFLDGFMPGAPGMVTIDLSSDSDTGSSDSDNITNDPTPSILVHANAGATVRLLVDGVSVAERVAGASGELEFTLSALADGTHVVTATASDAARAAAASSVPLTIEVDTAAPVVTIEGVTPGIQRDGITVSNNPRPSVAISVTGQLTDGAVAILDAARDDDMEFSFSNPEAIGVAVTEVVRTAGTLKPSGALPSGVYGLRARVFDPAGNEGISATLPVMIYAPLDEYVNTPDPSYEVVLPPEREIRGDGYTAYSIRMYSQTWRTEAEVNLPRWPHWVTIIVPDVVTSTTAFLAIDGGNNLSGPPSPNRDAFQLAVAAAIASSSISVHLSTVPNELVTFTYDSYSSRTEDEIIAYTFDRYLAPGDDQWPLLLPMVKSAVRAMDTAQAFVPTIPGRGLQIDDFVVSGASKRGWTTWLTGAIDPRVRAIVPAVFDALNLDDQLVHHHRAYKASTVALIEGYAIEIQDYINANIHTRTGTPEGEALRLIVDPYEYRDRLTLPKYIVVATGDEFFVSDSAQFYFHDLLGQKYLRYVPGTGHNLNLDAIVNGAAFYSALVARETLPEFTWTVESDTSIRVQTTPGAQVIVKLWQAHQPKSRDFRNYGGFGPDGIGGDPAPTWSSSVLVSQGNGTYVGQVLRPATGARAFLVELTYSRGLDNLPLVFTTEVVVAESLALKAILDGAPGARSALVSGRTVAASDATSLPLDASSLPDLSGAHQSSVTILSEELPPTRALSGVARQRALVRHGVPDLQNSAAGLGADVLFDSSADGDGPDWLADAQAQAAGDEWLDLMASDHIAL